MPASNPTIDPLDTIAAGQYGLVTLEQALAAGWTRTDIERRLTDRAWSTVRSGVYRSSASPVTWRQRALAACIGAGGALAVSHESAAHLHGLVARRPRSIEVLIPYPSSPKGLARTVRVHRTRHPPGPNELVKLEGIPVTVLARTLVDLAAIGARRPGEVPVAELLDRAMVACKSDRNRSDLASQVEEQFGRGTTGTAALRAALEPWSGNARDSRGPESVLEAQVLRAIRTGGLPPPVRQHRLDLPTGSVFVDFAWPDRRVALEVDGYRFHSGKAIFVHDRLRWNALLLARWEVLHTTAGQLARDAAGLIETIRIALTHEPRAGQPYPAPGVSLDPAAERG